MDQEATNPEFVEISDLDDEEGYFAQAVTVKVR
jgi:hypothetical protein